MITTTTTAPPSTSTIQHDRTIGKGTIAERRTTLGIIMVVSGLSVIVVTAIVLAVVLSAKGQDVNTYAPVSAPYSSRGVDTAVPVAYDSNRNRPTSTDRIDTIVPSAAAPTPAPYAYYKGNYDNVLMIVLDQLRYDTLGFMQDSMDRYTNYLKVKTPNIDSLAAQGVSFRTAHSQSTTCAPSRGTIKTGYTVAHHGITTNGIINERVYKLMKTVRNKVEGLRTLEDILRFNLGYTVDTYGKWHFPMNQYGPIQHNYYNYQTNEFSLWPEQTFVPLYKSALPILPTTPVCVFQPGDQQDGYSGCAYTPLPNDPRYGMPTNTSEKTLPRFMQGKELGADAYDLNHTITGILGDMGLRALDRIMNEPNGGPFLLSVHFNAPHPPRIAAKSYLEYYVSNEDQVWIPPSLHDPMNDSAYDKLNDADYVNGTIYELVDEGFVRDFTAVYYAMIEEVDTHIGRILDRLRENEDVYNRTLIIFTSDHGEMMGSHGLTGKGNLMEESIRVPLIVAHPSKIPAGVSIQEPVSHLDLVSTVLDYVKCPSELDQSDGKSLRRLIDRTSYNAEYDEGAVVVETDSRRPISSTKFAPRVLGMEPNFMIRHGPYKLMLPRSASSKVIDMMYDVDSDPYEMTNLLYSASDNPVVIGKAEHLKVLLVEWLQRHDTDKHYFSSNKYQAGQGLGDVKEIQSRRTWPAAEYWQSDDTVRFGLPVLVDGAYRRNEFLYVGGTSLQVSGASVEGTDASYFEAQIDVVESDYVRIKVSFASPYFVSIASLNASVVVTNSATAQSTFPIEAST